GISVPKVTTGDVIRPSDVTRVRAIPRNGKAYVYWRTATDNVAVDHYLVSTSRYPMDRKKMTADSAENQQSTKNAYLAVENLENDTDYYFYVMAVDAAGNKSSFWSESAHAKVKSSITPDAVKLTDQRKLNIRVIEETENYFLIRWLTPPTTTRFLTVFMVDGKLEFSLKNSLTTELKIAKTAIRKGKKLKLTISAFSPRGFVEQEKIDFSF
ncbi:MAG: hypothetical protein V1908_02470, partial [Candidatus Peregrinibacteria bacterium]